MASTSSTNITGEGLCLCCLNMAVVKNMLTPNEKWCNNLNYAQILNKCLAIDILNVESGDNKLLICDRCSDRLRDAWEFKKQVQTSVTLVNSDVKYPHEIKSEYADDGLVIDEDQHITDFDSEPEDKVSLAKILIKKTEKKKQTEAKKKILIKIKTNYKSYLDKGLIPFKYYNKILSCVICQEEFDRFDSLKAHIFSCHSDSDIGKAFKSMQKLRSQFKIKSGRLKCMQCSYVISNYEMLSGHTETCFKKELPYRLEKDQSDCTICGQNFLNYTMLNQHMNEHFPNFVCENCGKAFATAKRLKSHMRNHESGEFPCKYCSETFQKRTARENHVAKIHTTGIRYVCPRCSEPMKSFYARQKHLAEIHNEELKRYKCKVCPQSYITPGHLSGHVRRDHLIERNHICNKCSAAFYTKNALQMHMIRHDGERIFTCEICNKSYQRRKTLREHMRIHNNDKRFACNVCGRAFTQKCTLKSHIKVHERKLIM